MHGKMDPASHQTNDLCTYKALEGGYCGPIPALQKQHQQQEQRKQKTTVITRVAFLVVAILAVTGLGLGGRNLWQRRHAPVKGADIKRILQRHNEARHHGESLHGKHAAFVTKELGLEEMEHAAFDPEVAAAYHEDGLNPEDLGYEADYEEEEADDEDSALEEQHGGGKEHLLENNVARHRARVHRARQLSQKTAEDDVHAGHAGLHIGDEAVAPHIPHPHRVIHHARHVPHGSGHEVQHNTHHGQHAQHDTQHAQQDTQHGAQHAQHAQHDAQHAEHADNGTQHAHEGEGDQEVDWDFENMDSMGKTFENQEEEQLHTLKVKERLEKLFPLIDTDKNGLVSEAEMHAWHLENGHNTIKRRARKEFLWADVNGDGRVDLAEYLADLLPDSFHGNETVAEVESSAVWGEPEHLWILNNKRTFELADADSNGSLNETEHADFQHPEESSSRILHMHMLEESIRDVSSGHGKTTLNFEEFLAGMYQSLVPWDAVEEVDDSTLRGNALVKFAELDVNKDRQLSGAELEAAFHLLHPSEADYAQIQAAHVVSTADDNHDNSLSLAEMLNHPYVFYSSNIDEADTEGHDEF